MDYQMPVRAIKSIMLKELETLYTDARASIRTLSDVPREMLSYGYDAIRAQINNAPDHAALDKVCGEWYHMSLQEWIQSL